MPSGSFSEGVNLNVANRETYGNISSHFHHLRSSATYLFIDRDKSNVPIEKILGPESSPKISEFKAKKFIVKPDLSRQLCPVRLGRNPFSSQKCPIQSAASGKLFHVLSRQLPPIASKSHFCSVRHQ